MQTMENVVMNTNLVSLLAMAGYSPAGAAQELARHGFGDAATIQHALETGNKQALSFIPQAAAQVQQDSPGIVNQAKSFFARFSSNGNGRS